MSGGEKYSYLIFVILLTPALISSSKFDTKKCVNRNTADIATKQRKLNYLFAKAKIQLKFKKCGVEWRGVVYSVEWCGFHTVECACNIDILELIQDFF